ncbi:hypothetical protein [Rurimicrobium arvi]|uniref:hypothetical protein n=1 Tax=Rurimicrobium arvi TaxID=2049916 RepID=UPI0031CF2F96
MRSTLKASQTFHFSIPAILVIEVLSIIWLHRIRFKINHVSKDHQFLKLALFVNLAKPHQCEGVRRIEGFLQKL